MSDISHHCTKLKAVPDWKQIQYKWSLAQYRLQYVNYFSFLFAGRNVLKHTLKHIQLCLVSFFKTICLEIKYTVKKLLTLHSTSLLSIFFSSPKWQKKEVGAVLFIRSDLKRPRLPDHKVQAGAGKTDANRAHRTPPAKINSNRLNFQRPISYSQQSNAISEK